MLLITAGKARGIVVIPPMDFIFDQFFFWTGSIHRQDGISPII